MYTEDALPCNMSLTNKRKTVKETKFQILSAHLLPRKKFTILHTFLLKGTVLIKYRQANARFRNGDDVNALLLDDKSKRFGKQLLSNVVIA